MSFFILNAAAPGRPAALRRRSCAIWASSASASWPTRPSSPFLGDVPREGHPRGARLRFRLGERRPVLPGLDAAVLHRPLPEVAAALPPPRTGGGEGVALLLFRLEPTRAASGRPGARRDRRGVPGPGLRALPDEGIPVRGLTPARALLSTSVPPARPSSS
ncbi:MAG: hypothetical protein M0C28_32975 [Candidatus Moduliflexus flocculans]|nr:hypothetical protein [Candidatus Moduliflexus flocculans]